MNDPETDNRLSEPLCRELSRSLTELAQDPSVRVLILRGTPRIFCAGATLEALRGIAAGEIDLRDLTLARELLQFPVPVIGAVEGHAVGGGLILALCCDITVACETSRYGVNFTELGFTPGMGATALLPALAGPQFAGEMMLTAKFYKGRELKHRNLFTHIVNANEVMPLAADLALRIAPKPRPVLEMLKETLALPRRIALDQAVSRESLMHRICFGSPETARRIEDAHRL